MDEALYDSFMKEEGEIANISGTFHLDDDSRDRLEYRPSNVTRDMSDIKNGAL